MTGTLYGVGIGPGDAELMTLKAVRIIKACPIIVVPKSGDGERVALSIAAQAVPELNEKQVVELDMPMTRDTVRLRASHETAADTVAGFLCSGIDVAFLTLGDPTVYSTYIYVHRIVRSRGYPAEIIPGVPSFCAVSAKLDDCLVETSQPLHIIPGSYGTLDESLTLKGTKVLMKCGKSFPAVRQKLRTLGLADNARMIENCGFETQRIYHNLDDADDNAGYFSVIVVKDPN
jgi:precorrin-2/cobalt-factor-2 C20-methyltransferase